MTSQQDLPRTAASPLLSAIAFFLPVFVIFIHPFAAPVMLFTLACVAILGNLLRGNPVGDWLRLTPWMTAAYIFAAWALLSVFWSPVPDATATKACLVMLFITFLGFSLRTAVVLDVPDANRWCIVGVLGAFFLATIGLGLEVLTDQFLARKLIEVFPFFAGGGEYHVSWKGDTVTTISANGINRRIAVLALLFFPALMIVRVAAPKQSKCAATGGLVISAGSVILLSDHQSSQVGLVIGTLVFFAAYYFPRRVLRGLIAVWCGLLVLTVPLSLLPYSAAWHQAPWLFESARQRVIIWNFLANKTLERPILGVGADATRYIFAPGDAKWIARTPVVTVDPRRARHAHNTFLQTWYELGLIGALLLAGVGIVSIMVAGRHTHLQSEPILRSSVAGLLTTIITVSAFSFSFWQPWYLASIMLAVLVTVMTVHATPYGQNDNMKNGS